MQAGAYELYFGGTHSHTSYSDGVKTPADAFDSARNKAHLDFWAVTDHYEQFDFVRDLPEGSPRIKEWDALRKTALDMSEPGKFIAIAGYEWFDQSKGHMNVLNADTIPSLGITPTLDKFRRWAYKHPDYIIGFNHPGDPDFKNHFSNFEYVPQVASQTVYIGVNQLSDFSLYFEALDKGWRVAPVGEQDNHDADWGLRKLFAGVYANGLTYDSLMEAFRARRFYSTSDRPMRIWFEADGQPMGSEIVSGRNVTFKISVTRSDDAPVSSVKLFSNGGVLVKEWLPSKNSFSEEFTLPVDFTSKWFVAAAQNSGEGYSISAPVWINNK